MRIEDLDGDIEGVLITSDELQQRLDQLAKQVDADYDGRDLLIVGVLKGAVMVVADFVRALSIPVEMDSVRTGRARRVRAWCGSSRTSTPISGAGTC